MNFLTAPVLYALLAFGLAGWGAAGLQTYRLAIQTTATARAELRLADATADAEKARADAQEAARQAEKEEATRLVKAAADYEKQMQEAADEYESVIAGLRSGQLRLRNHWQGCVATAELSATATAPAIADEAARLRREAASRIVRVGAECDAQVLGLQRVIAR